MSRCRDCMYRDVQLRGLPSSYSGQLHTEGPPLHLEARSPAGRTVPAPILCHSSLTCEATAYH